MDEDSDSDGSLGLRGFPSQSNDESLGPCGFGSPAELLRAAGGGLTPPSPDASRLQLCIVPIGMEMARMLGDGSPAEPWLRYNEEDNGWCWISVQFGRVERGSEIWREPNVDCHVTLLRCKLDPVVLQQRLQEVRRHIAQLREKCFAASGVFCSEMATPAGLTCMLAPLRMVSCIASFVFFVLGKAAGTLDHWRGSSSSSTLCHQSGFPRFLPYALGHEVAGLGGGWILTMRLVRRLDPHHRRVAAWR